MVDTIAQMSADRSDLTETAGTTDRASKEVAAATMTQSSYAAFSSGTPHAPAQSPAWVGRWMQASPADTIILAVEHEGTRMALPLEIGRAGPLRIARFMGGSHANGNFPASRGEGAITARAIAAAARASGARIDVVHLERLAGEIGGKTNPLASLPSTESPNLALAVDLDGGFEALLARTSGKRKRKKNRSQMRKFEAAGGFRRLEATTEADVDRVLTAFFAMKADRFGKMGIRDVFADNWVQAFFRNLFKGALGDGSHAFVLHALEVGGELRAVTGSSRCGDRLICEFGAIREDELAHTSPGDFLFFDNIQQACADGFAVYDFSVGDEFYKRLWCNIETRQFDVAVPVTIAGHALATTLAASSRLKRAIKNNQFVWSMAKRLRRQVAAQPVAEDAD